MGTTGNGNGSLFDEPVTCADALRIAAELFTEAKAMMERAANLHAMIVKLAESHPGERPIPAPMQVIKHSPVSSIFKYFDSRHKSKLGDPAKIEGGKDAGILTRLLKTYDENRICELIDLFFETDDEFTTQRTGYTIGAFSTRIPGLISSSKLPVKTHGVTRNTEGNARNATAAAGLIRNVYGNGR